MQRTHKHAGVTTFGTSGNAPVRRHDRHYPDDAEVLPKDTIVAQGARNGASGDVGTS